jgi:hypothetical protein
MPLATTTRSPWVQYFRSPFAIHTAYWREDFGQPKSGGCINLSPEDAHVVFELTDPPVPEGRQPSQVENHDHADEVAVFEWDLVWNAPWTTTPLGERPTAVLSSFGGKAWLESSPPVNPRQGGRGGRSRARAPPRGGLSPLGARTRSR